MSKAFMYIAKNGIGKEDEYPYRAVKGECHSRGKWQAPKMNGFKKVEPGEQNLLDVVAQQPVAVYIAGNKNFDLYKR